MKDKPVESVNFVPRSRRQVLWCFAAILVMLVADLASKDWAEEAISAERTNTTGEVCEPDPTFIRMSEEGLERAQEALSNADDAGREAAEERVRMAEQRLERARSMRQPQRIATEPVVLIEGYFEFRYAENCGAAFSMLGDSPAWVRLTIFGAAAVIAVIALLWMFITGRGGRNFALSVPFIVSGALGNLYDRAFFGYVVDFIRFHLQDSWSYPTFNVADIAITVGVVFLLLDSFEKPKEEPEAKEEPVVEAEEPSAPEDSSEMSEADESEMAADDSAAAEASPDGANED